MVKAVVLERILRWTFNLIFALGILPDSFGSFLKANSLEQCRSLLVAKLFEATTTVPWGLYLVGEGVKILNSLTRRKDGTMNRKLADFFEIKVAASAVPVNEVSSKDVVIDEETNVWVRIFTPNQELVTQGSQEQLRPASAKSNLIPVVVYYHGGGFGVLCADYIYIDRFCRTLSKTCNIVIVSVNYRRAPENRYPAAYDDSLRALKWLHSSHSRAHIPSTADISRCFLAGDSAGGNIAHFMACRMAKEDGSSLAFPIRGVILLQPFFGSESRTAAELSLGNVPIICTENTDWHWKAFLPDGASRDHPACNIFGPEAEDISQLSLPPIFMVTGSLDLLKDHHARYAWQIRQMGKQIKLKNYPGGFHGFFFLESLRTKISLDCIADIDEFIQSCLDGSVRASQGKLEK